MQELVDALMVKGFTRKEAEASVSAIVEWVKEKYPIAGGALNTWFAQSSGIIHQ